jgi:hypothetical protein
MDLDREVVRTLGNLLRAAGEQLVKLVDAQPPEHPRPYEGKETTLLPVARYAKRVGRSRYTVTKWVDAGLPCIPGPRGVLVEVKSADAWLANGGLRPHAHGRQHPPMQQDGDPDEEEHPGLRNLQG